MTQEKLNELEKRGDRAVRAMECTLDDAARWIESQVRKDKKIKK